MSRDRRDSEVGDGFGGETQITDPSRVRDLVAQMDAPETDDAERATREMDPAMFRALLAAQQTAAAAAVPPERRAEPAAADVDTAPPHAEIEIVEPPVVSAAPVVDEARWPPAAPQPTESWLPWILAGLLVAVSVFATLRWIG